MARRQAKKRQKLVKDLAIITVLMIVGISWVIAYSGAI